MTERHTNADGHPLSRYEIFIGGTFKHFFNDRDDKEEEIKANIAKSAEIFGEKNAEVKVVKLYE